MNDLFRFLFPKISAKVNLYEIYKKANIDLNNKVKQIEEELTIIKQKYNNTCHALTGNIDKLFAFENTHKNNEIIVEYDFLTVSDSTIDIKIWNVKNYSGYYNPDLKLYAQSLNERKIIFIQDIQINQMNINMGYGQFAVKKLIQFSKKNGYKKITGTLALCDLRDKEHRERLLSFYGNLGFKIILDNTDETGRIILEL